MDEGERKHEAFIALHKLNHKDGDLRPMPCYLEPK